VTRGERLIILWTLLCLAVIIIVASVVIAEILRLVESHFS
jgi:hypothetical protein